MINLKPYLHSRSVQELLSFCVGFPTPSKLEIICEQYRTDEARHLWGMEEDGHVIACLGFRLEQVHQAVIQCIAVVPAHRRQGIAKLIIKVVSAQFQLKSLAAETDVEAVAFYQQCGFKITGLGEVYPGTERFRCVLRL